jgi:hypothetical protein
MLNISVPKFLSLVLICLMVPNSGYSQKSGFLLDNPPSDTPPVLEPAPPSDDPPDDVSPIETPMPPPVINPNVHFGEISIRGIHCTPKNDMGYQDEGGILNLTGLGLDVFAESSRPLDRANCTFILPVELEPGYTLSVVGIEFERYADLKPGAELSTQYEIFAPGVRGNVQKILDKADQEKLEIAEYYIAPVDFVAPACGTGFNLRGNMSMVLNSNDSAVAEDTTWAQIDGVKLQYEVVPCSQ